MLASGSFHSADEAAYLDEAGRCLTVQCHRAAVMMLWTAAIARFHSAITLKGFAAFNAAVDAAIAKKGQPFNRIKDGELFGYDLQIYQEPGQASRHAQRLGASGHGATRRFGCSAVCEQGE
ncbi:MAG TPA: hypothetical protein VFI56_20305 [Vicinamibacterales bacterium]|nr:hypothetical protein [Vicinamibacterales bacterium]